MDVVITYVNGLDPMWQKQYSDATGQPILEKRYRDWGLLPFLLRGIEQHMSFIENVFLVVSQKSQVPEWVDTNQLNIVYHHDIIPQQHLPTFNSTTIELFLHKIDRLNEQFIYFNDDIFPIAPLQPTDFFVNNKVLIHFSHHLLAIGMYKQQCLAADRMAQKAAQCHHSISFIRPQHTCTPMLKSINTLVYNKLEKDLDNIITPIRKNYNVNQYLFSDYLYYINRVINQRLATQHCSMGTYSAKQIARHIQQPHTKLICINDVMISEKKTAEMRVTLQQTFARILPEKSRFEK